MTPATGYRALYWWIDRWLKSTAYTDMTLEQQGAYRNLLDAATLRGGALPDDDRILAKACGDALAWAGIKDVVLARFYKTSKGWRNKTLDQVLRDTDRRAEKQRRYRNKRGHTDGDASGNGDGNAHGNGAGHNTGNKSGSPDQDQDQDLTYEEKQTGAQNAPERVFCGKSVENS